MSQLRVWAVGLVVLLCFLSHLEAQTIEGCGSEYGCFSSPSECADPISQDASACQFVYKYKTNPTDSSLIDFVLESKVANPENAYISVGFSFRNKMANSSIVICKFNTAQGLNTVEHYYAPTATRPTIVEPTVRDLGIKNVNIKIADSLFTCRFSRSKSSNETYSSKFFDISPKDTIHILAAKGALNDQGEPNFHQNNRIASDNTIDFESSSTSGNDVHLGLVKAHGSLMVIAWVLFSSVGICLPRYMKLLFPKRKFFQVDFWFFVHRALMTCVPLLSIAAFLIILAFNDWKWVTSLRKKEYAHAIIGIITIALSMLQVIGGFLRPDKNAPNRNLFNWGHRLSGILTFTLSVVTISLAYSFILPGHSWTIVLIWIVWIIVVPTIFEILDCRLGKSNPASFNSHDMKLETSNSGDDKINTAKAVFFFIHFIVQVVITVVFIVRIVIIKPQ